MTRQYLIRWDDKKGGCFFGSRLFAILYVRQKYNANTMASATVGRRSSDHFRAVVDSRAGRW